jgi:hypothetical protein
MEGMELRKNIRNSVSAEFREHPTKIIKEILSLTYTDKKENQIFLMYMEIQSGAVAKSYMTNDLPTYGEIFAHFLIY